jgi:hypothetical protein
MKYLHLGKLFYSKSDQIATEDNSRPLISFCSLDIVTLSDH